MFLPVVFSNQLSMSLAKLSLALFSTGIALASSCTAVSSASCSCGYVLTEFGNAYFPFSSVQDFSKTPSGPATSANLPGWLVVNGWTTGGPSSTGVSCAARASNVKFANGALELVVPGAWTCLTLKVPASGECSQRNPKPGSRL